VERRNEKIMAERDAERPERIPTWNVGTRNVERGNENIREKQPMVGKVRDAKCKLTTPEYEMRDEG